MMSNMLIGILLMFVGLLLLFYNKWLVGIGPFGKWAVPPGVFLLGLGFYLGVWG